MSDSGSFQVADKRKPFRFWLFNKIMMVLVVALTGLNGYLNSEGDAAYTVGFVFGAAFGPLMLAGLITAFVYLICRRSLKAGNLTFLIISLLMVLGVLGSLGSRSPSSDQRAQIEALQEDVDRRKQELLSGFDSGDFADQQAKQADMLQSVSSGIDAMAAQTTSPDERLFFEAMNAFIQRCAKTNDYWQVTYGELMNDRFFDFSLLDREGEFAWQYSALNEFTNRTVITYGYMKQLEKEYAAVMNEYGVKQKLAAAGLKGMKQKLGDGTLFRDLEAAYLDYAAAFRDVLTYLETIQGHFLFDEEEGMLLETDEQVEQYNELFERLSEVESRVNDLNRRRLAL